MARVALVVLSLLVASCGGSSPTGPSNNLPACCWTQTGVGDSVFTMPAHVEAVRVSATFPGDSSNFVVWVGPAGAGCAVTVGAGCRLLINELLGTLWGMTTYQGTVQTGGGGQVAVSDSSGVTWTLTEVR